MGRTRVLWLALLLPSFWLGAAGDARAAFVWEETGPGSARRGLQAVGVDPVDPQVAWVTDGSRVWVTDDGGESWQVVLRATSPRRTSAARTRRAQDRRTSGDAALEESSSSDEEEVSEESRLRPLMEDGGLGEDGITAPQERRSSRRARAPFRADEAGIRLRVLGDSVYLCVQGGLWVADRSARSLGSDRRIRFGRQVAVLDVTDAGGGALWLSTNRGLMHLDVRERATPVQGAVGDRAVITAEMSDSRLLVATRDGLWVGDGGRFERVGIPLGTPRDLVVLPGGRAVVATDREVTLISLESGRSPEVLSSWPMAGVRRLAVDRDQVIWAAGPGGIWSRPMGLESSWEPQDMGLRDRRITGLAVSKGIIRLWLVGSGGAWRRVSERVRAESAGDRAGFIEDAAVGPGVWRTLAVAQRQRRASGERLGRLRLQQATAWLLPDVNVSYTDYVARDETSLFVDELDRLLLNDVDIVDGRPEWRVVAYWDLYAAVLAVLDLDTPDGSIVMQDEIRRVMKAREDLRDQVVPLYKQWIAIRAETRPPGDARRAVKHLLQLQHLEADLFAVTGGWFPVGASPSASRVHQRLPILSLQQGE